MPQFHLLKASVPRPVPKQSRLVVSESKLSPAFRNFGFPPLSGFHSGPQLLRSSQFQTRGPLVLKFQLAGAFSPAESFRELRTSDLAFAARTLELLTFGPKLRTSNSNVRPGYLRTPECQLVVPHCISLPETAVACDGPCSRLDPWANPSARFDWTE